MQLCEISNLSETMIKAILDRAIETGLVEGYGAGRGRNDSLSCELYQDKGKQQDMYGSRICVAAGY